jgi:hypothetical protein
MNPAPASAFFGRPRFRMSEAQAVVELCCRRHRLPCRTSFLALRGCEPATCYLDVGMKAIFHDFRIFSWLRNPLWRRGHRRRPRVGNLFQPIH